jgi:2-polyprenyl-3-methyl-5-hydroxy-6-metoxy-1,4-benzoquinol methylase
LIRSQAAQTARRAKCILRKIVSLAAKSKQLNMNITEDDFLKAEIENFNLTFANPDFVALAQSVSQYCKRFKAKTVLDFGCGTGVYSEVLRQNGFEITAQDVFKSHRDYCKANYPDLKVIQKPKQADLMLWIEVAEHMTDEEIAKALKAVNPNYILFSSTPETTDFDADWGHINIKQPKEWVDMFKAFGYELIDEPKTPTQWALTFQKI